MTGGYGLGPLSAGPYGSVLIIQPHPLFGGYGGSAYGFSPYATMAQVSPPFAVTGGYGGAPYGTGPYGSVDSGFPEVTSAISLDGFRIEVFFSEEMLIDSALLDPASYTFTESLGAPATSMSVVTGTTGSNGATSVIVTHTGTTLGGDYTVAVNGPSDISGNGISGSYPMNQAQLLTKGEAPSYTASALSGDEVLLDFDRDMLPESGFTPGIEEIAGYQFSTSYPVPLTIQDIEHPYSGDSSKVRLEVQGMTSTSYTLTISPADAIVYDGSILPSNATTFSGVEVGTGTSIVSVNGLLLSKAFPDPGYGWQFGDTSGKLIPNSSFLGEVRFDVSAASISPPLFDTTFATIKFSALVAIKKQISIAHARETGKIPAGDLLLNTTG